MTISFFDLDDTILDGTSNKIFFEWCLEKKIYGLNDILLVGAAGAVYKTGFVNTMQLIKFWLSRHKGWADVHFQSLMTQAFEDVIKSKIRPQAVQEIEKMRKKGKVVLLSASTQHICDVVGDYLNLDDVICTRVEIVDGVLSGDLDGELIYEEGKATAAKKYCHDNHASIEKAHYYGDAYADRFVLQTVGHPFCITPEPALKKLALKNKWTIYDWKIKKASN